MRNVHLEGTRSRPRTDVPSQTILGTKCIRFVTLSGSKHRLRGHSRPTAAIGISSVSRCRNECLSLSLPLPLNISSGTETETETETEREWERERERGRTRTLSGELRPVLAPRALRHREPDSARRSRGSQPRLRRPRPSEGDVAIDTQAGAIDQRWRSRGKPPVELIEELEENRIELDVRREHCGSLRARSAHHR